MSVYCDAIIQWMRLNALTLIHAGKLEAARFMADKYVHIHIWTQEQEQW